MLGREQPLPPPPRFVFVANYLFLNPLNGGYSGERGRKKEKVAANSFPRFFAIFSASPPPLPPSPRSVCLLFLFLFLFFLFVFFFFFFSLFFFFSVRENKRSPATGRIIVRGGRVLSKTLACPDEFPPGVSNRPIFHKRGPETIQPIANVEFDCRLQKERRILRFSLEIIAQLKR